MQQWQPGVVRGIEHWRGGVKFFWEAKNIFGGGGVKILLGEHKNFL